MALDSVRRYDGERPEGTHGEAIVLGGSMAGLLTARVLADAFEDVIVIERDSLPTEPVGRRGVPQSQQPHILMRPIQVTLDDLFPGFGEDLIANGGLLVDWSSDVRVYAYGDYVSYGEYDPTYCASRPLIEHLTRQRVRSLDAVTIRDGCQFVEYRFDAADERVTGVTYTADRDNETELTADLVVDATGRPSRTPRLLDARGYPTPPVDELGIEMAYSSLVVERPPDDHRFVYVPYSAPRTRGGGAFPIENGRWIVTVAGIHGDRPPSDAEQFSEFAATLPAPDIERIVTTHRWLSDDVEHYPFPSNRRRRYEALEEFPDGLLVIGDAIASFNPAYGQGLSVAALEVARLHHCLVAGGLEDLGTRFFDQISGIVDEAWMVSLNRDVRFPSAADDPTLVMSLFSRYLERAYKASHTDEVLSDAIKKVVLMERSPKSLLRPTIVHRVLRN